jgi:hypothetical protein
MYLGFIGDPDFKDSFKDRDDWNSCFKKHANLVGADDLIGKSINCEKSKFTLISRSYEVPEIK